MVYSEFGYEGIDSLRAVPLKYTWKGGNATYFRPPTQPIEKKTTQHKKNMVSPPQPTEKQKNGVPPSQVDLNGTALM